MNEKERKTTMDRCCFCGKKFGIISRHDVFYADINKTSFQMCWDCYDKYMTAYGHGLDNSGLYSIKDSVTFFNGIANSDSYPKDIREAAAVLVRSGNEALSRTKEKEEKKKQESERREQTLQTFPLTTSPNFDNYTITEYIGIVSGESFLGTGIFSDVASALSDTFGIESEKLQDKMKKARSYATQRMISDAYDLGANAIIGVHYEYFSMASNMLAVSVSGTAVVRKQQETQE